MCSHCGHVKEHMRACPCCRAWYCDTECQLKHWPMHLTICNACSQCGEQLTTIRRCKRCMVAKYCDVECQKAHWSVHKKECTKHE
jgi:hypothetical protein